MITRNCFWQLKRSHLKPKCLRKYFSSSPRPLSVTQPQNVSKIRNIGIIAHIDAGKTTTTERMLYYSGYTKNLGDVDDGSTITDFLPAERARGITIQSAAITFYWPPLGPTNENLSDSESKSSIPHQINLIDTPGHADFTFEVLRSLRVLDGAICILDGVAGVEAQTEKVWTQSKEMNIPRICFVNKLDRDGANFNQTIQQIGTKLNYSPIVYQLPWYDSKGQFNGLIDVVGLHGLLYDRGDGKSIKRYSIEELKQHNPGLVKELIRARVSLIELLCDYDDILVEDFLEAEEDHMKVSAIKILQSLRKCLSNNFPIVPVFVGASLRNIGIQPLLDAINNLLPSPSTNFESEVNQLTNLRKTTNLSVLKSCALAFKVVTDPKKGILVYIRVYHGSLYRNDIIFNTNLQISEKVTGLAKMYASESVPIQSIDQGQIGVIMNSKNIRTGDTLISYNDNKTSSFNKLLLRPIPVPPPVFFASLEPTSLKDEKNMNEKLELLLREDPSLRVIQNDDTGQTLLCGMGELHLEIAKDRLIKDFKANCHMGKIDIGYRESLTTKSEEITKIIDKSEGKARCTTIVKPIEEDEVDGHYQDGNIIEVKFQNQSELLPGHLNLEEIQKSLISGILAALSRGPKFSFPMYNIKVLIFFDLKSDLFGNDTNYSTLTTVARLVTKEAIQSRDSDSIIMEPIMNVDINVDDENLGKVVQDISSARGGSIISLGDEIENKEVLIDPKKIFSFQIGDYSGGIGTEYHQGLNIQRTIKAKIPLKEMIGYLKHLRSFTGGKGTFVMDVDKFERVKGQREKRLISELRGI